MMRAIEPYAGLTLDPCEGTGWLTVIDLDGVHVSACIVCNAAATKYPTSVPPELRDQVLDAINERRQLLDDGTPAEGQEVPQPTEWDDHRIPFPRWPFVVLGVLAIMALIALANVLVQP